MTCSGPSPTFVDLIEHVADWTRDAPLLLLIMARPELLDARPGWGGGKLNATTVLLEPLPETDARDLLRHLIGPARLDDRVAARILAIAEGNPLFVEEIVAMLIDDGILSSGRGDGSSAAELAAIAVPADDPGADRRPARPARRRASAQSSRPPRSRARNSPANVSRHWSIHGRERTARCPPTGARPQGPDPPRGRERGQLPLPPSADPRRRLRRDAEAAARRSSRALRAPAERGVTRRPGRRRVARPPSRARGPTQARARRDGGCHHEAGGARIHPPLRRRTTGRPARRPGCGQAPRASAGADPTDRPRADPGRTRHRTRTRRGPGTLRRCRDGRA